MLRVRPGADLDRVREAVFRRPCRLTFASSRADEFIAKERDFWDKVAPIGTVFYIGVVMGFIVGLRHLLPGALRRHQRPAR